MKKNNSFLSTLAKKVLPIGAVGLIGLGIISHSVNQLSNGLSEHDKFLVDIIGLGLLAFIICFRIT